MESDLSHSSLKPSSLRWQILRHALLRRPSSNLENSSQEIFLDRVSRRTKKGFNLIPCQLVNGEDSDSSPKRRDACLCYSLPFLNAPKLFLRQRWEDYVDLNDFKVCNQHDIDNTGLVCQWPSEDVLAYYSMSHLGRFRGKRVIELGSGYGLAGFVIAMASEASEVVISDGNPQVVDYIRCNIDANFASFGSTKVNSVILHWDQFEASNAVGTFDVIVASDCWKLSLLALVASDVVLLNAKRILQKLPKQLRNPAFVRSTFFKEFHKGLAQTIRCLLKEGPSEAILFSPKRGDSLEKFLAEVKDNGLRFTITETYDSEIYRRHENYSNGDQSWPNYESDHCYPLLVRITR